ncbi:MAG: CBS domain-containing protein [Bacteroidota bacterium]
MKISASLYSNKTRDLQDLVAELDSYEVDYFHIDSRDRLEVFDDIANIRSWSNTPIDLHIISQEPERFLTGIQSNEVELVTYQYEDLKDERQVPQKTKAEQGLAITSETPIEVFEPFQSRCDFVLFMTTIPGMSGGKFQKINFQKIRAFKKQFPHTRIHVDGGVNHEISFILRNLGVASVVSGSYLVNDPSIGAAMLKLRRQEVPSPHFLVGEFMLGLEDTPLLPVEGTTFLDALESIEQYGLGLTIVVDADRKIQGIVTNADVRRGLLRHRQDLNQVPLSEIINPSPVVAMEDQTVSDMLEMVKNQDFPILYLPVVNAAKEVVGTLTFTNLIKGEG